MRQDWSRVAYADQLLIALRQAIQEQCDEEQVAVLFSGGLDSTVIAKLASERCRAHLYTVGVPGSHDLQSGKETAEDLGLDWQGVLLDRKGILGSLPYLADLLGTDSPLVLSFEMPLYVIATEAKEHILITGQGADELFGGYARYSRMSPEELRVALSQDLEGLLTVGAKRERELAEHFGKVVRHPYLHGGVVRMAGGLPLSELVHEGERKKVLREVATRLCLGKAASRPKKAAQYGSGSMKEMKAEARRRGLPLSQLVGSLRHGETL